jgi:hypothetical protein
MPSLKKSTAPGTRRFRKVVCVGWHKTGTSTMGDALIQLGYNVLGARLDTAEQLLNSEVDTVLEVTDSFDALQDVPWALLYREFDAREADCAFILTERNGQAWLDSAKRHFGNAGYDRPIFQWMYGAGRIDGNEQHFLKRYRAHNADVRAYFKSRNNFLVMNFENGDQWPRLCEFLGHPIPSCRFPHSNQAREGWSTGMRIRDSVKQLLPRNVIQNVSAGKAALRQLFGLPDVRDRFHNRRQNVSVRNELSGNLKNGSTDQSE